ncbi:MAG: recombinase family protein [Patescibacteria group bacterium]
MDKMTTTAELTDALNAFNQTSNEIKLGKNRYVIYARKSSNESEEKQIRSLPDQILVCEKFAFDNELRVVEKIQEAESAKEPDTRPKFRKMIQDLKIGKYDGIIAWHPDRLARNMKDAGEVIDLLDKSIIKDLKFVSFSFENNTSGKMLLGITFVLSKQYSDHLSDNVHRGNRLSIEEGKYINKPKQGYYKDSNQYLRPDGENFILIKNAFKMRLDKKTFEEIATYLNENNYCRAQKNGTHKPMKMDKQQTQKFMSDPTYAGVLVYGKTISNLTEKYDFEPAISVEDFLTINKLDHSSKLLKLAQKYRRGDNIKANLMRGMIVCDECGETMHAGITAKKNKKGVVNYFYYRCDTEICPGYGKSIRAKVVLDYVYNFLDKKPFSSRASYDHYVEEMKNVSAERLLDARKILFSMKAQKRKLENDFINTKELLVSDKSPELKEHFKGDLDKIQTGIKNFAEKIEKQNELIANGKGSLLTYSDFLELMEKTQQIMRKIKNMKELDYVCRKIFMNFIIKEKKVIKSTLSSPFDTLFDAKKVKCGDGEI